MIETAVLRGGRARCAERRHHEREAGRYNDRDRGYGAHAIDAVAESPTGRKALRSSMMAALPRRRHARLSAAVSEHAVRARIRIVVNGVLSSKTVQRIRHANTWRPQIALCRFDTRMLRLPHQCNQPKNACSLHYRSLAIVMLSGYLSPRLALCKID